MRIIGCLLAATIVAMASPACADPVTSARQIPSGLELTTPGGVLTVEPWSDRVVHVRFGPAGYRGNYNPAVVATPARTALKRRETAAAWLLVTPKLTARIEGVQNRLRNFERACAKRGLFGPPAARGAARLPLRIWF